MPASIGRACVLLSASAVQSLSCCLGAATMLSAVVLTSPAWAEFDLIVDGNNVVRAERVEPAGQYLSIIVAGAVERPLRLPPERIACGKDCPQDVYERIAQAKKSTTSAAVSAAAGPGQTVLQIHGSNTIGEELMPKLVSAFVARKYGKEPRRGQMKSEETYFEFDRPGAAEQGRVEIYAHGSNQGFEPLFAGKAQIWMSSRPARDKDVVGQKNEVALVRNTGKGDLRAADSEHIVALDGLAIIVHKENPVSDLQLSDIRDIFSGKTRNWSRVGGRDAPITLYRRDDKSGTTDTFKSLVLNPQTFASANAFESSEQLETAVSRDPNGIGFVAYGYAVNTKKLAVSTSCGLALAADPFSIRTEEYPLARRLFLYTIGAPDVALARELIEFSTSAEGQAEVEGANFVNFEIAEKDFEFQGVRLAHMLMTGSKDADSTKDFLKAVRFAKRLSLTFRFGTGDNALDTRALADVRRLARELRSERFRDREFMIIGFSDDAGSPQEAVAASVQRALAVKNALEREGVPVYKENLRAFGLAAPVACNDSEHGRMLNRRVEVWVR